ncbi:uncharacterized protein LOC103487998 isoform X2 [Cucumis melo]|uniref:Uncharacterized protein LOC103487998 isoform X2 n=1 Tax=Cucumis melo TaxID=3656 RepID=A0ABM3KKJ6_CUCME|nr:uncharacterized protein LOC103487998 isoform X2 [Cucumis melo]
MEVSETRDPDIINVVVYGVISWTLGFVLLRKVVFPNRSFEFCNRLISTIHAFLAVTLASISVQNWRCPICPLASKSSSFQMQTLGVSCSYLIYDMVCCHFDKKVSLDNTIHHLVSIVGIAAGFAYQKIGFAVIFSFARMVGGPYLTYMTLSANVPFLIKAMALGLQLVSAYWFYKIVRMIRFKLKNRSTLKNS